MEPGLERRARAGPSVPPAELRRRRGSGRREGHHSCRGGALLLPPVYTFLDLHIPHLCSLLLIPYVKHVELHFIISKVLREYFYYALCYVN